MPSGYKKKDEFKNCLDVLEALIEEIPMTNSIVLIGDFNIDLFKASYKEDIRSISLRKMMKSINYMPFHQMNHQHTEDTQATQVT